ncbi:tetratricopeptide repeat protein [Sulfuricurvum sp.]|uniref:tetratricopeptide repeat protein n=1 Tax=Sulfuricurvum sp. TaxID=2025608 RepID=UPI0035675B97
MIDNFDQLVERCSARRRRHMIHLSFLIVGGILLLIALIAGYMEWSSITNGISKPLPKVQHITPVSVPFSESNTTIVPSDVNKTILPLPKKTTPSSSTVEVIKPINNAIAVAVTNTSAVAEKPLQSPSPILPKPQNSRFFDVNNDTKTSTLDPLKTFDNNPKYETALAVARDYYGKNNFVEAAVWAKKANQMNREGEEAWMLYARSYYAQGRKTDAIGVLELYLNFKDSKAALELLRTWKQNP